MKLKSVELQNFRGFKTLELSLPDAQTLIFIGGNGAGKTSLLQAIGMMLSWLPARIRSEKSSGNKMDDTDIFNDESSAFIGLCLTHDGQDVLWSRVKKRLGRTGSEKSVMDDMSALALHFRQRLTENRDTALPLVAYYPVNRSVTEAKLEPKSKRYNQLDAFSNAFTKASSFNNFFEWFRNREDLENEQRLKLKDFDYQDHQLMSVRAAITAFLPELSGLRIDREEHKPRLLAEKAGKTIVINQLSDGEKCLLALVGDLARRLALANPAGQKPLKGEGIILIDEIELHLHPRWQRNIVPGLEKTFPNCQFVITTHSPQVLGDAKNAAVYALNIHEHPPIFSLAETVYGRDASDLLEEVMDASSRTLLAKSS
ncbi:AAA family ATPase [Endozoicomonas euniceicola]|uniref:AAA family ATPase n=1 Tax=Endozoicomonas euniceicola TaxID=1234143 RepID=A0ABY6H072_9GAMM|nr:AAA family ATPase [Endozoicomonas euniceicola]UYM17638.1 AAA family ATPase [Endozoicomonas euniceicola]